MDRLRTPSLHPRRPRQAPSFLPCGPYPSGPVARNADYRLSGFNRGHLVPAEHFASSTEAIAATLFHSNTAPQLPSVNQRIWRRVENSVRIVAAQSDAVYVFTGPIIAGAPATLTTASADSAAAASFRKPCRNRQEMF
ncbi:MAG: DNA/RNA non-specific endonuclease [Bryobacteraceae bacterium]